MIDSILDRYFGNKLAVLIARHWETSTGLAVKWLYDSGTKEYALYVEQKEVYQFPRSRSVELLFDLLAHGWGFYDSLIKEAEK